MGYNQQALQVIKDELQAFIDKGARLDHWNESCGLCYNIKEELVKLIHSLNFDNEGNWYLYAKITQSFKSILVDMSLKRIIPNAYFPITLHTNYSIEDAEKEYDNCFIDGTTYKGEYLKARLKLAQKVIDYIDTIKE